MKMALFKDGCIEIKKNFKRFIALVLMSFLGVGFFAGIRAASFDMGLTLNKYYRDSKVFDINVVSTLGIDQKDLDSLKGLEGVESVTPGYEKDKLVRFNNTAYAARLMVYNNNLNVPKLSKEPGLLSVGEIPENDDENWCLADSKLIGIFGFKVGDLIEIEDDDLKHSSFRIAGVVDSPLYMSADRGNNKYAGGRTDFYIYLPQSALKDDVNVYTNAYIRVKGADRLETDSNEYNKLVDNVVSKINSIKEESEKNRYEAVKKEAEDKIRAANDEIDKNILSAQKEIDKGFEEIDKGLEELKLAGDEISLSEESLEELERNKTADLHNVALKFEKKEQRILAKKEEMKKKSIALKDKLVKLKEANVALDKLAKDNIKNYPSQKDDIKRQLNDKKKEISEKITTVNNGIITFDKMDKVLSEKIKRLNIIKEQVVRRASYKIDENIAKADAEFLIGKKEIEENEKKLKDKKAELLIDKQKLDEELKKARLDIKNAQKDLEKIKYPKWYIFDRNDNIAYNGFIRDISSVAKLGGLFPLILFLIAALISLNSMTRMVEEQRIQIGTLKALGYSSRLIARKYIAFAFIACVIGGVAGMSVGFVLLPKTIWKMYDLDYSLPNDLVLSFDYKNGAIGLFMMLALIILATVIAIFEELKEVPAALMRPKAPKKAKRVLLENIGFIWRALNFSQKVTIRNIFRYKKRFLMTIIGIMGCTSLVVSGFGLRDSVSYILNGQYVDVFKFDMIVRLSDNINETDRFKAMSEIEKLNNIQEFARVNMSAISLEGKNRNYEAQLIVPDNIDELRKVINLHDKDSKNNIKIVPDKVYLSDKLAELLGAGVGSTVTVISGDEKTVKGEVGGILENYLSHYMYVSKEFFDKNIEGYYTNTIILKNEKNDKTTEAKTTEEILSIDNVETVILSSSIKSMLSVMMNSLNYVVVILVLAAALLNFIVLYNLSTLNISERSRELATIKVLGFYDREVYSYLDRETILLTIMGIALGLFGGHYLNALIVKTCEVDLIRFTTNISLKGYLLSAGISAAFAFLVNIITYFSLKRVDMIDSLKSVE